MSNFAELSGGDDKKFLVRWRGKQQGPFPASAIEAKFAANEIGLLHEILHEGKWVTIRDYLGEREAVLRAERQALEERERRTRQEAEREARERAERQRAELLAKENQRTIEIESAPPQLIREEHLPPSSLPRNKGNSGLKIFGTLLLIAGLATGGYFFLAFETSIESGSGRVVNLGLMADRQNGIIIGIGLCVVGTIMLAVGSRSNN